MKKKSAYFLSILISVIFSWGIVAAAFPQTLTNWQPGNVITSAWLNSLEQAIIGTSTPISQLNALATTTGNIAVGSSTTGWNVLAVGANGLCLVASSSQPLGMVWSSCSTTGSATTTYLFPLTNNTNVISVATATAATSGILTSADWTTFNGKISTSTYNASITIATAAPLGGGASLSNGGTVNLTCTGCLTGNQTITLTGPVTGSGATTIATTITSPAVVAEFDGTTIKATSSIINAGLTTSNTENVSSTATTNGITNTGNVTSTNFSDTSLTSIIVRTDASHNLAATTVGSYLSFDGTTLQASSTLASSTLNFTITAPTTTAPSYSPPYSWDYQRFFTKIQCFDINGTSTLEIYNSTSNISVATNDYLTKSIVCGKSGGSTTSITSSTLLAGYGLIVNVTSTTGSATDTVGLQIFGKKQ